MIVSCAICSDNCLPSSCLSACPCGHVFHVECLMQWFERSKTCPQCREPANERKIIRIYLSILESSTQEDPSALIQKIDALKLELISNRKELNTVISEKEKLFQDVSAKEVQLVSYEQDIVSLKSQNSAYRKHLKNQKDLESDVLTLKKEKEKAEALLRTYESLQRVLNGSNSEAEEELQQLHDGSNASKSLAVLCSALKKQLCELERKLTFKNLQVEHLKKAQQKSKMKMNILESDIVSSNEMITRLEDENEQLKRKMQKMKDSLGTLNLDSAKDKMLTRLLEETPMPEELQCNTEVDSSPEILFSSFNSAISANKKFPLIEVQGNIDSTNVDATVKQDTPLGTISKLHSTSKVNATVKKDRPLGAISKFPSTSKVNAIAELKGIANVKFGVQHTKSANSIMPNLQRTENQSGQLFANKSKSSSSLFGSTRTSRLASSHNSVQKRLYLAARDAPDGMVYNGLGGTVKADFSIPSKKKFLSD